MRKIKSTILKNQKKITTKINTRILFDLVINIHENNTLNNQLQNVTLGTAMFFTEKDCTKGDTL